MQITAHDSRGVGAPTAMHTGSKRQAAGLALSWLAVLFLLFDSAGKLFRLQAVVDGARQLGYSPDVMFGLGLLLLTCVVTYVIPRTSMLGALLLTGYLGGAVATHVRVGSPLVTHVLFPTYVAALLWAGLILRDPLLRIVLPIRRKS